MPRSDAASSVVGNVTYVNPKTLDSASERGVTRYAVYNRLTKQ